MNETVIKEALSKVIYPGFKKDIVTFGFVKDITVENDKAFISVDITSSAPEVKEQLLEDINKQLQLAGVKDAKIDIATPQMPKESSSKGKNIAPGIKNFVMVSSGKGGVGKSTTSVNLAVALAQQGKKVGLLDADIYGPNVPRMMGIQQMQPEVDGNTVKPIDAYGVKVMSMGSLMKEGESLIWRGAMVMKVIVQLLQDIQWGELDVLVIDMPPGTGDAQLTLAQNVPVTAGVTVTTPQKVSLDDSRRSLDMFNKFHIPQAGIIENMSGFICPECENESEIFGKGTCEEVAKEYDTTVLAQIPLEPMVRDCGDDGTPVVHIKPESVTAKRYYEAANNLWAQIEKINAEGGVDNAAIQPNTPPGQSACSTQ